MSIIERFAAAYEQKLDNEIAQLEADNQQIDEEIKKLKTLNAELDNAIRYKPQ